MAKRKPITAGELMAQLENDPEYQERLREKKRERAELRRLDAEDEKELVAECNEAGFAITSVWDFVKMKESYAAALPILARHLEMPHRRIVFKSILRAISVPEAWGIVSPQPLIRMFPRRKWA